MAIPQVDVDFLSDLAVRENPFPFYEEVRAAGRVVWNGAMQAWMVPGFDDCFEVLTDTRAARFGQIGARYPEANSWFEAPNMITVDGKEHQRLRSGLSRFFGRPYVARWAGRIREVVEELLAPLGPDATFELEDFTKVPVIIVAEMLGVPEEHHDDFRRWSNEITGKHSFGREEPELRRVIDQAIAELNVYLDEEIARHRREQPDDVFTAMVNMPDWSEAEIRSSVLNLLLAGYDTTAKLMTQCLVTLEQHPDQRRLLAEEPALIPNAIEEVVRWAGVAPAGPKVAKNDPVLAGTRLRDGDILWTLRSAANRDPSRWPEPHLFDVLREPRTHIGFGAGAHFCIGAPLARLEVKSALEVLLRRAPEYQLRDLEYGESSVLRGPERGVIGVNILTDS